MEGETARSDKRGQPRVQRNGGGESAASEPCLHFGFILVVNVAVLVGSIVKVVVVLVSLGVCVVNVTKIGVCVSDSIENRI